MFGRLIPGSCICCRCIRSAVSSPLPRLSWKLYRAVACFKLRHETYRRTSTRDGWARQPPSSSRHSTETPCPKSMDPSSAWRRISKRTGNRRLLLPRSNLDSEGKGRVTAAGPGAVAGDAGGRVYHDRRPQHALLVLEADPGSLQSPVPRGIEHHPLIVEVNGPMCMPCSGPQYFTSSK